MKKLLGGLLALALGIGVGGSSAYAVGLLNMEKGTLLAPRMAFVPTGRMTAPLVFADGRLSAYIAFEAQLEVPSGEVDAVLERLPVLMHAVNMRTYRKPLASGPDGMIPELGALRQLVAAAAAETYGKQMVQRVVVTQAVPI